MRITSARARVAGTAVAVVLLLSGAGCARSGVVQDVGHDPGPEGIKQVVETVGPALAEGNGKRVCSLLTREAQERLAAAFAAADCLDATAKASVTLTAADRAALEGLRAADVQVDGASGSADVGPAGGLPKVVAGFSGKGRATFQLSEGRWSWHVT